MYCVKEWDFEENLINSTWFYDLDEAIMLKNTINKYKPEVIVQFLTVTFN